MSASGSGDGQPGAATATAAALTAARQQVLDLKIQLDERTDELEAARSANRELTKTLNQSGRTP
jgi:hypothetical protein